MENKEFIPTFRHDIKFLPIFGFIVIIGITISYIVNDNMNYKILLLFYFWGILSFLIFIISFTKKIIIKKDGLYFYKLFRTFFIPWEDISLISAWRIKYNNKNYFGFSMSNRLLFLHEIQNYIKNNNINYGFVNKLENYKNF